MRRNRIWLLGAALAAAVATQAYSQSTDEADASQGEAAAEEPGATADPEAAVEEEPSAATAYDMTPEPDLPQIPAPPQLSEDAYPECRDEYKKGANYLERADLINACTVAIDTYYLKVLLPHTEEMIVYQNELSRLYVEEVAPSNAYREGSKNSFYSAIMRQHARSNPDGANMAEYRTGLAKYQQDRVTLEDRFCYNTGCNGYQDPLIQFADEVEIMQEEALAEAKREEKAEKQARRSEKSSGGGGADSPRSKPAKPSDGCKRARKRGSALGSFLGGAASALGGFGKTGSALLTGFSGLVVGEIACQLDEKEQEVATQATVEVLDAEEVGATAEWTSPTRQGVSGSSTVTALNTEPNGRRCLNITDVAIIDGAETKVQKQMCRAPGAGKYVLVA